MRRTAELGRPGFPSLIVGSYCTGYVSESGGIAGRETDGETGEDRLSIGTVAIERFLWNDDVDGGAGGYVPTTTTRRREVCNISLLALADGDRVHVYDQDGIAFCRPFYEDEAAVSFHNE